MKKTIFTIALTLLAGLSQAQGLKDDLIPNKSKSLSKILPFANDGTPYQSFYNLDPQVLLTKISALENELTKTAGNDQKDAGLIKADAKYYGKSLIADYLMMYGLDSLGFIQMEKMLAESIGKSNYGDAYIEAEKKGFPKKLSKAQRAQLLSEMYQNPDITNEALFLRSLSYRSFLSGYLDHLQSDPKYKRNFSGFDKFILFKLDIAKDVLKQGPIREYFIYNYTCEYLKGGKDDTLRDKLLQEFKTSVSNKSYIADVNAIYQNNKFINSNSVVPDFNYADVNGKMVSLGSLKGKYVYIDIWATWCVPCKAEIPYVQKLEEEFRNKNIQFVSLSVNQMKDHAKWVSYVKDNNLGGIQIIADHDFSSDFIKKFNINAIPRFILIDPAGKIVDGQAKRPSDPKLRAQLDQLLK